MRGSTVHGFWLLLFSALLGYSEQKGNTGSAIRYRTLNRKAPSREVSLNREKFDPKTETRFVIPGYYMDDGFRVKDALLDSDRYKKTARVVIVEWEAVGRKHQDALAQTAIPAVAKSLCEKIIWIHSNGIQEISMYGEGYGAHIAGQAARCYTKKKGKKFPSIAVGDPASDEYFKQHPMDAVQCSDAKKMLVIHTNKGEFGWPSNICKDDHHPHGGKLQPDCKHLPKMLQNKCSHEKVAERYAEYVYDTRFKAAARHPWYVLVLDRSAGMKGKRDRITIMAAMAFVKEVPADSFVGIVWYSTEAHVISEMKKVTNIADRVFLLHKLAEIPIGGKRATGTGLRKAMDILKKHTAAQKICPTVFLITAGQENSGEKIAQVLPDLKKFCIRVDSIAVGKDAEPKLEDLSWQTGGIVSAVQENGWTRAYVALMDALVDRVKMKLDIEKQPVFMEKMALSTAPYTKPTKVRHTLIVIDNTFPREITITFYYEDIGRLKFEVTAPNGKTYSDGDGPHYAFVYEPEVWKAYIMFPDAEHGTYKFKITSSKALTGEQWDEIISRHEAFPNGPEGDIVRVSGVTDSGRQVIDCPKPLKLFVAVTFNAYPVILSEVHVVLEGQNKTRVFVDVNDKGHGPDDTRLDGIYTGEVATLPELGRYTVKAVARRVPRTRLLLHIYHKNWPKHPCREMVCEEFMSEFEREGPMPSIELTDSKCIRKGCPLDPIDDLQVIWVSSDLRLAFFEWTVPNSFDPSDPVKSYSLRADLKGNGVFKFLSEWMEAGDLSKETKPAGQKRRIAVKLPEHVYQAGTHDLENSLHEWELPFYLTAYNNACESDSNEALGVVLKYPHICIDELKA